MKNRLWYLTLFLVCIVLAGCMGGGSGARNNPPRIVSVWPHEQAIRVRVSDSITFSVSATDPDGERLEYLWSQTGSGEFITINKAEATWQAPDQAESAVIKVIASDGNGGTVSHSWDIEVSDEPDEIVTFEDPNLEMVIREIVVKREGELTKSEVERIHRIDASGRDIKNLGGIEHLTNLRNLDLDNNHISDASLLKNLPSLRILKIYNNNLTELDLSDCSNLEQLWCHHNQLTSLDVSGCTELNRLNCSSNLLSYIDLTGCISLDEFFLLGQPTFYLGYQQLL